MEYELLSRQRKNHRSCKPGCFPVNLAGKLVRVKAHLSINPFYSNMQEWYQRDLKKKKRKKNNFQGMKCNII